MESDNVTNIRKINSHWDKNFPKTNLKQRMIFFTITHYQYIVKEDLLGEKFLNELRKKNLSTSLEIYESFFNMFVDKYNEFIKERLFLWVLGNYKKIFEDYFDGIQEIIQNNKRNIS